MRHDHFAERAAKTLEEMAASLEEDMRRVGGVFFSGRGPWRALALPLAPIHASSERDRLKKTSMAGYAKVVGRIMISAVRSDEAGGR